MKSKEMKFKISSALKNIIGKELITDQYIAVFELVKNGYDAHSENVIIKFENLRNQIDEAKIIIFDKGKGMDYEDLKNKWLFVAYSAKKDKTEDDSIRNYKDYRDKLGKNRIFAGAKGVGRFSCDRLGKRLRLFTKKDVSGSKIELLEINWDNFESDSKKEFVDIEVLHKTLEKCEYEIENGTILEITGLNDIWLRKELQKLKIALEKLINPEKNTEKNFSIELIVPEEKLEDEEEKTEYKKINGFIENRIFETLNIKTTSINVKIDKLGENIITTLFDRGNKIYKIKEKNSFILLKDIEVNLFHLNRSAKINFKKIMEISVVEYGAIFMYKNGFRVYPFGEVGEDALGIDRRKQQGHSRYLGTREIIGRIEIHGENPYLVESTSRDNGLIKNSSYDQLVEFFMNNSLKRLEKYVVDIIKWAEPLKDKEKNIIGHAIEPTEVKDDVEKIIKKISTSNDFIEVEYGEALFKMIEENEKDTVDTKVDRIKFIAEQSENKQLKKDINEIDKTFKAVKKDREQLEEVVERKEEEIKIVKENIKIKDKQALFLKSASTVDKDYIMNLNHQVIAYSGIIEGEIYKWKRRIKKGKNITNEDFKETVEVISFQNQKIRTIAKFATKANFNMDSEEVKLDLSEFIYSYLNNVYLPFIGENVLNIKVNKVKEEFLKQFKPIEVTIVLDNLINNSKKVNAKNINVDMKIENEKLLIIYEDDGKGLHKSIININEIFEKGFSTTDGSGLGMYYISNILKEMNGTISVKRKEKGILFSMEVCK